MYPSSWWLEISLALFAERHRDLLWDALADVYFTSQTGHTNIGRIWTNWDTTLAAQDVSGAALGGLRHVLHFPGPPMLRERAAGSQPRLLPSRPDPPPASPRKAAKRHNAANRRQFRAGTLEEGTPLTPAPRGWRGLPREARPRTPGVVWAPWPCGGRTARPAARVSGQCPRARRPPARHGGHTRRARGPGRPEPGESAPRSPPGPRATAARSRPPEPPRASGPDPGERKNRDGTFPYRRLGGHRIQHRYSEDLAREELEIPWAERRESHRFKLLESCPGLVLHISCTQHSAWHKTDPQHMSNPA